MAFIDNQDRNSDNCQLCNQPFNSWSAERIQLHEEACSQRKAQKLSRCPTALEHIRACAKFLNVSPPDILLNGSNLSIENKIRPRSSHSLKGKSYSRAQRIDKTKKKCGKISVLSIDHLLISVENRRVIFLDRLSRILNEYPEGVPLCYKNRNIVLSSDLWNLAALSSNLESLSDLNQFYVKSLSPLIIPAQKKQNFNRLRLSQIPGRGPSASRLTPGSFTLPRSEMERIDGVGKSLFLEMLSRMVDSPICSDLSIYLDSGIPVSAHRFILAAWNPKLVLLEENTSSINAPGMSKEELLGLLRALYTFDLSFLSSLSPEAEFTLDCWQMLDAVRNRIQSNTASSLVDNPAVDSGGDANFLNAPGLVLTPFFGKKMANSHEGGGSDSSVDLFASMTDDAPSGLLKWNTVAASHSTPHLHPSLGIDVLEPINRPLDSCPASGNAPKNNMDPESAVIADELCHSPYQSVEPDIDPPAFFEGYDTSRLSVALPSLPFSEQRVTKHPDYAHTPLTLNPSRNKTSDHCFLFDGSVPTPAPLAKRLQASADSTEVGTGFSFSSQPLVISSDKGETGSDNSNDDDDCQFPACFSQPVPTTPANGRRTSSIITTNAPITPKPAFDEMRTPELRKALSDYGVRRLPKKKAIQLLNHIYDELHPYVEAPPILDDNESKMELQPAEASLGDCAAGVTSDKAVIAMKPASNPPASTSDQGALEASADPDQETPNDTLRPRVWECLRSNDHLYFNIVTYVPLELDCVKAMLREAGINVGLRRLSDMLDSWGVTFTTRSRHAPRPGTNASDPRAANYLW
ncbi:Structure-specific endonuclease subunit SLX4 [Echinococcus granulosus]|nr:Structure-specific endonuclease subunit SLX4 [Echinococcus granulosus]